MLDVQMYGYMSVRMFVCMHFFVCFYVTMCISMYLLTFVHVPALAKKLSIP